jgi:hypothetical protein
MFLTAGAHFSLSHSSSFFSFKSFCKIHFVRVLFFFALPFIAFGEKCTTFVFEQWHVKDFIAHTQTIFIHA